MKFFYFADDTPIMVFPTLAKILGLNQSIVLQELHFWITENIKEKKAKINGETWCKISYREWHEIFPFWSQITIKRIFLQLEKEKLIISANYNRIKSNRTKWYRINYANLNKKVEV